MPPRGYKYPPGSMKKGSKKGPKPFPGSLRKRCDLRVPPVQPIMRPKKTYPKKRKAEVLTWLVKHRVPEHRLADDGTPFYGPRRKKGQPPPSVEEELEIMRRMKAGDIIYRPPTYQEADTHWKIPASTINAWWKNRAKYLPADVLKQANATQITPETMGKPMYFHALPGVSHASSSQTTTPQGGTQQNAPAQPGAVYANATAEPAVMEISSDEESEEDESDDDDDDDGDDGDELPDIDTAINGENAESVDDAQDEFEDAAEFPEGQDDDADAHGSPEDQENVAGSQDVQECESDEDAEGFEDTDLFQLQTF